MAAVFKRRPDLQAVAKWGVAIAAGATALWIPFDYLKREQDLIDRVVQRNDREGMYVSKVHVGWGGTTLEFQQYQRKVKEKK